LPFPYEEEKVFRIAVALQRAPRKKRSGISANLWLITALKGEEQRFSFIFDLDLNRLRILMSHEEGLLFK